MDIIPTYQCNMRCSFCFNKDNWETKGLLDLNHLRTTLEENKNIVELTIIGGEPSLLPSDYLYELITICKEYLNGKKPDFYTNLIHIPEKHILENIDLYVSYDPCDRVLQDRVLNNMLELDIDFSINTIITKKLIYEYGIKRIDQLANRLRKPLYLSKINVVTTNGIRHMQPIPDDIVQFTINLHKLQNEYIHSSLLRVLNKSYKHTKPSAERFDYNVSINPDGRFQTSGLHGMEKIYADSYQECLQLYEKEFKLPEKCLACKYNEYCIDEYRHNDDCSDDYSIMERFERYYNEHLCNVSM